MCGLTTVLSVGQSIDCKKIKTGKFKSGDEKNGYTIITRTGLIQREQNDKYGIITEDTIEWLSDCKFKIIMGRVIKNDSKIDISVDMKFEVEILVTPKYRAETTLYGK